MENNGNKKSKKVLIGIAFLAILILACIGAFRLKAFFGNRGYSVVPVYTAVTVNEKNPCIELFNPKENDVYFSYQIRDMNTVLYEIEKVNPGKSVKVDLTEFFDTGYHRIQISASCFDMATKKYISWCMQEIDVMVE